MDDRAKKTIEIMSTRLNQAKYCCDHDIRATLKPIIEQAGPHFAKVAIAIENTTGSYDIEQRTGQVIKRIQSPTQDHGYIHGSKVVILMATGELRLCPVVRIFTQNQRTQPTTATLPDWQKGTCPPGLWTQHSDDILKQLFYLLRKHEIAIQPYQYQSRTALN